MKTLILSLLFVSTLFAQPSPSSTSDPKERIKAIRDLVKQSEDGITGIAAYVRDSAVEVRLEVVKQLNTIGGPRTLPSLIALSGDADAEIQINAIDGMINVFLPGYLKMGVARTITRSGTDIKAKFTDNMQVVEAYVTVPADTIAAATRVLASSKSMESRANAARALGIFRAQSATKQLGDALYSKDDQLMFEAVIAIQKIRDAAAGPSVAFLVRDLNEKIQIAALRTCGFLSVRQAAPAIRGLIDDKPKNATLREAVKALAMIADPADRGIFLRYLGEKDAELRSSAAEGLARIKNPADVMRLEQAFNEDRDYGPRMAAAFALAALGRLEMNETSAYRYLVNGLDRAANRGIALAYLTELAREPAARQTLYPALARATADEKSGLCVVFGESGAQDSVRYLQTLKDETDVAVAQVCLRSLRTLEARMR